jgi:hypothetical protein
MICCRVFTLPDADAKGHTALDMPGSEDCMILDASNGSNRLSPLLSFFSPCWLYFSGLHGA